MEIEIQWLGHASFRLSNGQSVAYIDPWKIPTEPHDADVVFVSHSHYDHCSPPDIEKVSHEDTAIIAPAETIQQLSAANAVAPGECLTIKTITIEAVAAYNVGKTFHPKSNAWCGAVFTFDAKQIYYAGDTDLIPEMSDLREVDVALLPVGGTYTLSAEEAVAACRSIEPRVAIPYHWGDIVGSESDAERFRANAPCRVELLMPGETFTI